MSTTALPKAKAATKAPQTASPAAADPRYTLAPLTYTNELEQVPMPYGEGWYPGATQQQMVKYAVRGNYRMPIDEQSGKPGGGLQYKAEGGTWQPLNDPAIGYDSRQDSNAQGSNERLRFDQGFLTAPAGTDMRGFSLQQQGINSGWTEPDRSKNEGTLGSMISDIAPKVGLMLGGIGAMGGLTGLMGGSGAAFPTATTAAEEALTLGVPAEGLGAGSAFPTAASAAEEALQLGVPDVGSAAPWTPPSIPSIPSVPSGGAGAAAGSSVPYGQSMATPEELAQMKSLYPDWKNALDGVTDAGSLLGPVGNTIKSLLGGTGTPGASGGDDWLKSLLGGNGQTLGALGSSLLGYLGSKSQTDALTAQADKYSAMGEPYRQRLSDLYANPSSFLTSPGVKGSVDQGTQSLMRSLSTQGNPFGSGNALQQGQSYATNSLYDKLNQEKQTLGNLGGLSSFNAAAPTAATQAITSGSNAWNALGAGANNIFNPPQTAAQTMAEFYKAIGKGP